MVVEKRFLFNIRREVVINIVLGKDAYVVEHAASNKEFGRSVHLVEVQSAQLSEPKRT